MVQDNDNDQQTLDDEGSGEKTESAIRNLQSAVLIQCIDEAQPMRINTYEEENKFSKAEDPPHHKEYEKQKSNMKMAQDEDEDDEKRMRVNTTKEEQMKINTAEDSLDVEERKVSDSTMKILTLKPPPPLPQKRKRVARVRNTKHTHNPANSILKFLTRTEVSPEDGDGSGANGT